MISIKRLAFTAAAGCVMAVATLAPAITAPAAEPNEFQKLVADKAPSIVTIKFILKDENGQQESEASGTLIDASGLIITSNASFGGMMARMGGSAPTPTDIKVLAGDDTQGVKAKFLARDTELGLAWVQVEEAPAKPYPYVDFSQSAEAKLGDKLVTVSLMGKIFDRAPMVADGFVAAVVRKPRNLLMPSVGIVAGGDQGLPVYDGSGKVIGITTLILPEADEMEGGNMREAMRGFLGAMVLPAKEVVDATAKAKETAKNAPPATDDAKKDDKKEDKPADADKPKENAPKAPK